QRVQGIEKPDRESRAGTHAASGRQIAVMVEFQAAVELQVLERLANGRVADLVHTLASFDLAVNDAQPVLEKGRQIATGQIAKLVDRRGEDRAAVLAVPRGIVRAAAEKRNAEGGTADDHGFLPEARTKGIPLPRVRWRRIPWFSPNRQAASSRLLR